MDQVTTGLRKILSRPEIYDGFQSLLGGDAARKKICAEHIKANPADTIVDIGCGTAQLLRFLPQGIQYYGFDLSPEYIKAAKSRYASMPNFQFDCADINTLAADEIPPCDLAISFGVLHHIGDEAARALIDNVHDRLAPGGRLVTIDNAFVDNQSFFAKALIQRDRGQHVRRAEAYLDLVSHRYSNKTITIRHDLLRVPYTHVIMECTK
jgi:Trans-aconitate methyltransferase